MCAIRNWGARTASWGGNENHIGTSGGFQSLSYVTPDRRVVSANEPLPSSQHEKGIIGGSKIETSNAKL